MNLDERLKTLIQSLKLLANRHKDNEPCNEPHFEEMHRGMEEWRWGMEEMHQRVRQDLTKMLQTMGPMIGFDFAV